MTDSLKIAIERFNGPYSCSQAVFSAFAPRFGLSDEQALKIAAPFGGGTAIQGHVCGAVSGALMVLGLARGSANPDDRVDRYQLAQEFIKRFEEQHGSILCRELTGYDFQNPDEFQAAKEGQLSAKVCPEFVKSAAELVNHLLEE